MVEGARLESVCAGNRTRGSNPRLSAKGVGCFPKGHTNGMCVLTGRFRPVLWGSHLCDLTL